jgi:hypothetical protein
VKAAEHAGHRVLSSEPSGSESDLFYARLSDLLADLLPEVTNSIPGPQREALEVALLLREAGERPSTAHAVGLAVLAALQAGQVFVTTGPPPPHHDRAMRKSSRQSPRPVGPTHTTTGGTRRRPDGGLAPTSAGPDRTKAF